MTDDTVDLSGRLLPFYAYYPFPALVPNRLGMNATEPLPLDDLALRRLKKRRLLLRDQIARLEVEIEPPEPA